MPMSRLETEGRVLELPEASFRLIKKRHRPGKNECEQQPINLCFLNTNSQILQHHF